MVGASIKFRIVAFLAGAAWVMAGVFSQTDAAAPAVTNTVNPSASTTPGPAPSAPARATTSPSAATMTPGADGLTGNALPPEYCAHNKNPGCPAGSYVGLASKPDK